MPKLIARPIAQTEKCFLDESIYDKKEYTGASMLLGERFSFQVAYCLEGLAPGIDIVWSRIKIESPIKDWISVQTVENVPVRLAVGNECADQDFLRREPGLYPDLLKPFNTDREYAASGRLQSLWIDINVPEEAEGGSYPVKITLYADQEDCEKAEFTFTADVIPALLPEQQIAVTQWFHIDCLAVYYGVEMFSEEHWSIMAKHLEVYRKNGLNMIFTPVFTPALDTVPGGERPTCQLVDVYRKDGKWSFGFERLERWVNLCLDIGIEYFEISHLFTQWGAKHAPKVMAHTENGYEKVFGWETDACGEEYPAFLKEFIPALIEKLEELEVEDCTVFHISDEPGSDMLESYNSAKNTVNDCLKGQIIMDALSDYSFYEKGVVEHPVVSTDHVGPYLEAGVSDLWVYYCCGQHENVSNLFIAMPSERTRVLGMQLFKYAVQGFLQWGFNFYNSQYSIRAINPFEVTDAGGSFPSGDSFVVYPAENGTALESLRLKVLNDAFQDLSALRTLEKKIGREKVLEILEKDLEKPLTFKEYPHDDNWLLTIREKVNQKIKEN